jgi:phenylpropionate dioxygenase-like ring-hydroxylating dioxygenase large terminal subunit
MFDPLQHWQPVAMSRELRRKPVHRVLAGRDIVVFRTTTGIPAALDGRCPHRGMLLSEGKICDDRIQCPYHGWRFAANGRGQNLSAPDAELRTVAYETLERYGLIWIKNAQPKLELPFVIPEGYRLFASLWDSVPVPLQLLLDNFTEIEHTGGVHWLFGYPQERMAEVHFETAIENGAVHCRSAGPQKRMLPGAAAFLGVRPNDNFVIDWITRDSPLHVCYRMHWEKPNSHVVRKTRLFEVAFFGEATPDSSWVSAMYFSDLALLKFPLLGLPMRKTLQRIVRAEYKRDRQLLVAMKGRPDTPNQYRWSRFDSGLIAQRKLFAQKSEQSQPRSKSAMK